MPYAVTISDSNSSSLSKYPSVPRLISTQDQFTTISSLSSSPDTPKTRQARKYHTILNKNHSKVSSYFSKLSSPSSKILSSWSEASSSSSLNSGEEYYCNCKKSKCLKKYCVCFQNKKHCGIKCYCNGCQNTPKHGHQFEKEDNMKLHSSEKSNATCHCQKSNCLKKYCVCITKGKICTESCRCTEARCKNRKIESPSTTAQRNKKKEQTLWCNCRNSKCQNKYCVCFVAGQECGIKCQCVDCQNGTCTRDDAHGPMLNNQGDFGSRQRDESRKAKKKYRRNQGFSSSPNIYPLYVLDRIDDKNISQQTIITSNNNNTPKKFLISNTRPKTKLKRKLFEDFTLDDDADEKNSKNEMMRREKTKNIVHEHGFDTLVDSDHFISPCKGKNNGCNQLPLIPMDPVSLITTPKQKSRKSNPLSFRNISNEISFAKKKSQVENVTKHNDIETDKLNASVGDKFKLLQTSSCQKRNSNNLPKTNPVSGSKSSDQDTTPELKFDDVVELDDHSLQQEEQNGNLCKSSSSQTVNLIQNKSKRGTLPSLVSLPESRTFEDKNAQKGNDNTNNNNNNNNIEPNITVEDKIETPTNVNQEGNSNLENIVIEHDNFNLQQMEQNSELCRSLPKLSNPTQTVTSIQKSKRKTPASSLVVNLCDTNQFTKKTKMQKENDETMANITNIKVSSVTAAVEDKTRTLATNNKSQNNRNSNHEKNPISGAENSSQNSSSNNKQQQRQSKRLKFKTTHSLYPNPELRDDCSSRFYAYPNKDEWIYPIKIKRTAINNKSSSLCPNAPLEKHYLTFEGDNTIELSVNPTNHRLYITYRGSNMKWKTPAPCDLGCYYNDNNNLSKNNNNKNKKQQLLLKPLHVIQFKKFIFRNIPARYFHLSTSSIISSTTTSSSRTMTTCHRHDILIIDTTSDKNGTHLTPDARRLLLPYARRWFDFITKDVPKQQRQGNVDAVYTTDTDELHYVLQSGLTLKKNKTVELVVNPPIISQTTTTTAVKKNASSSSSSLSRSEILHHFTRCGDDAIIINEISDPYRHPHMTFQRQLWGMGMTKRHVVDILNYILEWLLPSLPLKKDDDNDDITMEKSIFQRLRWTVEQLDTYCRVHLAREEEKLEEAAKGGNSLKTKLQEVSRIILSMTTKQQKNDNKKDDGDDDDDAYKYIGRAVRKEMEYGIVDGFVEDYYSLKNRKNNMYRYKIGLKDGREINMTEDEVEKYCVITTPSLQFGQMG